MAEKDALRNRRTVTGSAPDLMIRRSFYTQIPVRNRGPPLLKLRFSKSEERLGQK